MIFQLLKRAAEYICIIFIYGTRAKAATGLVQQLDEIVVPQPPHFLKASPRLSENNLSLSVRQVLKYSAKILGFAGCRFYKISGKAISRKGKELLASKNKSRKFFGEVISSSSQKSGKFLTPQG